MKDFNIAKYLKENNLGSHSILGAYVDLHSLKEEEDYGNNKPVDEVPYTGAEEKLDGFGDEFDQVEPVSEVEDGEENPWMTEVDATEAYKIGNWTCDYDHPGILVWSHKNLPYSKLAVYATPNWDGNGTTPIQIDIDQETQDNMTLNQGEFADFNEYATAMKPYLDRIEDLESDWGTLAPTDNLAELEKPTNIYADDEDSSSDHFDKSVIAANMEQIYDGFELDIQRLISRIVDAGFDPEDAAQFLRDYADHLDKQK